MDKKTLYQLKSYEYEHEFDRKALETLEGTPGLEKLARKFNKHAIERVMRLQYTGSALKVNKNNFPDIYKLLEEACEILQINIIPDLYISWDYSINGFTTGSENPLIVLHSGALDLLNQDELLYLIGHEVGHIKSGHMLYHEMGEVIPILGDLIASATLGLGGIVGIGLEAALFHWYRMSELSADRAGLLVCQNNDAVISALMKMSGVPKEFYDKIKIEDFIQQAREFQGYDYDSLDKVAKAATIMWQEHPWTVMRAHEILKWFESGKYEEILEKHSNIEMISETTGSMPCLKCGFELT
ncbi:MAG: M48 family metallopeptidase, partial [Methanobacteriaceae archaeon]|nr:M48 family metallopeptidase [Methanobacteriaceae archaeon]